MRKRQSASTVEGSDRVHDATIPHDITPSWSFFVDCASGGEQERLFAELSDGGEVLMPTDDYGFSKHFAWVADRFGVSWQLNLA